MSGYKLCKECRGKLEEAAPRLPRVPDTPEWLERMDKISREADALTPDNLKSHYVCAMANWGYTLDERDELQQKLAQAEARVVAILRVVNRAVPASWFDSLLSGDGIPELPWGCPEIERLLNGVRDRLRTEIDAALTSAENPPTPPEGQR